MAEYLIRDAEGREVRHETTATDAIAPFTGPGETAELVEPDKKPARKRSETEK